MQCVKMVKLTCGLKRRMLFQGPPKEQGRCVCIGGDAPGPPKGLVLDGDSAMTGPPARRHKRRVLELSRGSRHSNIHTFFFHVKKTIFNTYSAL